MPHTSYHFDWNTTPTGGIPPASTASPESFLSDFAGIDVKNLTDEHRIFLPSSGQMQQEIGMARTGLGFDITGQQLAGQQNLLAMTGGQGLAGASGSGFGRAQYGLNQGVGRVMDAYGQGLQRSMAKYRSDVLGSQYGYQDALTSAIANIMRAGEGDEIEIGRVSVNNTTWSPPQNAKHGSIYNFGGNTYYWSDFDNSWLTQDEWNQEQRDRDPYGG